MYRYVEVQFSMENISLPLNMTTFQDIIEYLKMPTTIINTNTHITIGRRFNHNNSEYYGKIGEFPNQTLKYHDIIHFLHSLSIQINSRGKFILQQSALLHSIQQHNTGLLEIIEESVDNSSIIETIQNTKKKVVDLDNQKKELERRQEEIMQFNEKHGYLIEVEEKRKKMEKEVESLEKKVSDYRNEIQKEELELKQIEFAEKRMEKEKAEEEWKRIEREREEIEKKIENTESEWNSFKVHCCFL